VGGKMGGLNRYSKGLFRASERGIEGDPWADNRAKGKSK